MDSFADMVGLLVVIVMIAVGWVVARGAWRERIRGAPAARPRR